MTRYDIDTVRSNAKLLTEIAKKIADLERIIELRGKNFAREKELADLHETYNLIANSDKRNALKTLITQSKLSPIQKIIFYEYYINGKSAKEVGATCCLCERAIHSRLQVARNNLGFHGKYRTNHS